MHELALYDALNLSSPYIQILANVYLLLFATYILNKSLKDSAIVGWV
mgnify:CR=1 FL=1|jgi:hypothetical protein